MKKISRRQVETSEVVIVPNYFSTFKHFVVISIVVKQRFEWRHRMSSTMQICRTADVI